MSIVLRRHITYIVAALIACMIGLAIKPSYPNKIHGILLPAGETSYSKYDGSVALLTHLPAAYQMVGYLHLEQHVPKEIAITDLEPGIMQQASRMAAKAGANALYINVLANTASDDVLGEMLILHAVAIKI